MKEFIWLLFSYLFASIPNGFLITKWVSKKDIRKIGAEKLSGSNIMQNIGFLPGLLSGLFDAFKGVLAVRGAQIIGLSMIFQALSGIFALCGQMWPIFFNFWGGRGGSVLIGTLLILSPKTLFISAALWILCKIISWDKGAPIGMFLFLILAIILGFYFKIKSVYIFSSLALLLVLLQRVLGKPGSLWKIKDKKIFLYRFFLDRDTLKR
jgi:acyl-phosphate glycerol 3-phosphate acyltransferase